MEGSKLRRNLMADGGVAPVFHHQVSVFGGKSCATCVHALPSVRVSGGGVATVWECLCLSALVGGGWGRS